MPSHRHHEPGDLYVHLTVKFPDSIDPTVIPHLEKALPPRNKAVTFAPEILLDEVEMQEPDARQKQRTRRGDEMDEDDGETRGVQCANQ